MKMQVKYIILVIVIVRFLIKLLTLGILFPTAVGAN